MSAVASYSLAASCLLQLITHSAKRAYTNIKLLIFVNLTGAVVYSLNVLSRDLGQPISKSHIDELACH